MVTSAAAVNDDCHDTYQWFHLSEGLNCGTHCGMGYTRRPKGFCSASFNPLHTYNVKGNIGAQPEMHLRVFECGVCTSENLERLTELQKICPTLSKVGHKFGGGIFSL